MHICVPIFLVIYIVQLTSFERSVTSSISFQEKLKRNLLHGSVLIEEPTTRFSQLRSLLLGSVHIGKSACRLFFSSLLLVQCLLSSTFGSVLFQ